MKWFAALALCSSFLLSGCSAPEVGSPEWCADMKQKPEGEWTMDETKEYAKNCLFK